MLTFSAAVRWLDTHALTIAIVLALTTALLRAGYALASRILAPYPRARAFVEAIAAMAPDVLRFLQQFYRVLTGRDLPSTQPASIVPPVPGVEIVPPAPFDASARQTVVAPAPHDRRAPGQSGSAVLFALLCAFVTAVLISLSSVVDV